MPPRRQLAAIMFTDIVGYTAMMQHSEPHAVSTVKHYQELLNTYLPEHEGKVLNYYGDGSLAVFNSAVEAVQCAVELQQQFQQTPKVPLRIGIHIGEVMFDEGKVFGDGVNIASRIESLGQEGGVLFSKDVAEKLKNLPEFQMVSLGEFDFKNVDHPLEVFALANPGFPIPKREEMQGKLKTLPEKKGKMSVMRWAVSAFVAVLLIISGLFYWEKSKAAMPAYSEGTMSIAVLPFRNLSGDSTQEYISDGITEDLITEIAHIRNFKKVISGTSVLAYKNTDKSTPEIAKELGVSLILEGTARFIEDKVKITAQLIEANSDKHLWAEEYDTLVSRNNVMEIQGVLAKAIAESLDIQLSASEKEQIEHPITRNGAAYDLFMQARAIHRQFSKESVYASIDLLREAIKLDPNFHEAYTLLAWNHISLGWSALNALRPIEAGKLGLQAIDQAIEIDPRSSDAYLVKGALLFFMEWDMEGADKAFKKAMKVKTWWNLSTPYCFCAYIHYLIANRRYAEAEALRKQVFEFELDYAYTGMDQALVNFLNGNMKDALKGVELQSSRGDTPLSSQIGCRVLIAAGQYQKAIDHLENELSNLEYRPAYSVAILAEAYRKAGKMSKARELITGLEARYAENDFDAAYGLAFLAASDKAYNKVLEYLEVGFRNHDWSMFFVNTDPYFDPMRKDPKFRDILKRMNFRKI